MEGKRPDLGHAEAEVVFCEGDHVESLLRAKAEAGGRNFVLVSGNSDINFGDEFRALLPSSLRHWFGQNVLFEDPRVSPLPIGLENRYYGNSGKVERIERIKRLGGEKQTRIFCSFNVATNRREREPALAAARRHPLGTGNENRISIEEFQTLMASCKFALSPPGNGFDCHRTWEALYLGTVPIVKKSAWSDYFIRLGIPMLAVDSWDELASFDESKLDDWYDAHRSGFSAEALFIDYWKTTIEGVS
ncbi:MAG: hypothetical protein JXA15_09390 [Spirochaetales bacterium]|nr:hypothetical protein [Spirochaetales bacterium]